MTEFKKIYEHFLSEISDDYLASLDDNELHEELFPMLAHAITKFNRLTEFDLYDYDEEGKYFNSSLSLHEVDVLSILMKPKWLKRYINDSKKIEQQYYDAGIKTYSPTESIRSLLSTLEKYEKESKEALYNYNKATMNVAGNFSGVSGDKTEYKIVYRDKE